MKLRNNQNGFTALEVILVIVVIGLIGGASWMFFKGQKDKKEDNQSQRSSQQSEASSGSETKDGSQTTKTPAADVKTVTYESASASFELPQGWIHKKVDTLDAPLHYIIDPTNKLQLELNIHKKEATGSTAANLTPLDSFSGNAGKTYYLHGYTGSSKTKGAYEIINLGLCKDTYCDPELPNGYELTLVIRSADLTTSVNPTDPIISQIKQIVQSIKY